MFLISMAVAIQYRSIKVATWHSGWYHYSDGIFPFHPKDGNVSASLSCQLPVWRLARVQDLAILSERVCMIISGPVQYKHAAGVFFLKRDDCSEISTAFQLCGIRTYVRTINSLCTAELLYNHLHSRWEQWE